MAILRIDHVQLSIPPGGEAAARRFYGELLGCREVPKPAIVARLAAAGVTFTEATDQTGVRRGHVHDPFGNRIELVASM